MDKIRIGTRGSKLALKQAFLVQEALRQADGMIETEIVVVHTKAIKFRIDLCPKSGTREFLPRN